MDLLRLSRLLPPKQAYLDTSYRESSPSPLRCTASRNHANMIDTREMQYIPDTTLGECSIFLHESTYTLVFLYFCRAKLHRGLKSRTYSRKVLKIYAEKIREVLVLLSSYLMKIACNFV